MVFTHDTEVGLAAAAALVNTAGDDEELPDLPALDRFVDTWGWTGRRDHTEAELRAVRRCAPGCGPSGWPDEDGVVEIVNELLAEFRALPHWSDTENGTTTCMRRPTTRRWPPGWRWKRRWRWWTWCAATS